MLFAKPLLDLAYGDRFGSQPLEWIIVLAGLAALITFARVPLEMAIAATKQSRPLFWVHVWSVPLLVLTGPTLIHRLGIYGVPISSIIISAALLALTYRALRRVANMPREAVAIEVAFVHVIARCATADSMEDDVSGSIRLHQRG
jgi:O-antigen/teichoic acid export membrane protein